MSYPKEVILKADSILAKRRQDAESQETVRLVKAEKAAPEIAGYRAQLTQTGAGIAKSIAMGKNAGSYIKELSETSLHIQKLIEDALVAAGLPEDYLKTPYTCSKCEDTGFVDGYCCACRRELLTQLNVARLEAVSPAADCRFDNFDVELYDDEPDPRYGISCRERMSANLEYCKCYAEDFDEHSDSLYFHGATGLGKTHLSLAIANAAVRKGYNVLYYSAQNLFSALEREKFSYTGSSETENAVLDCDLLIIDDLGAEFITQFTVSAFYNIVNTRINTSKPVIISTNLTENELESKYSQRITSRIVGCYQSLLFIGRDVRQISQN